MITNPVFWLPPRPRTWGPFPRGAPWLLGGCHRQYPIPPMSDYQGWKIETKLFKKRIVCVLGVPGEVFGVRYIWNMTSKINTQSIPIRYRIWNCACCFRCWRCCSTMFRLFNRVCLFLWLLVCLLVCVLVCLFVSVLVCLLVCFFAC